MMKSTWTLLVAAIGLAACGPKPAPPVVSADSVTPAPLADATPARVDTLFVASVPPPAPRRVVRPAPPPPPPARRGDNRGDNRGADRGDNHQAPPVQESRGRSLDVGTDIRTTLIDQIHSGYNGPGDPIRATVASDVLDGGRVVIPAGAVVTYRIHAIGPATSRGERATLDISAERIEIDGRSYPISGSVSDYDFTMQARPVNAGDVATAAGGAGIGAIVGHVIGGRTGTIVGAIGGAAAGTAIAARNADRDIVVRAGTSVTLSLLAPFERN
jgi:hypothetical protein